MKVVLFCGGLGTRLRDYSETIPKPMVKVGYRPILWNIMRYYAHYGHKEFILALGHQADVIKSYFAHYDETISNDFVYEKGEKIHLLRSDIHDWKITLIDTGIHSNIAMRLMKVKQYLEEDELFMANYSDGLSDLYLPGLIDYFKSQPDKVGCFATYQPKSTFHTVVSNEEGEVQGIIPISKTNIWIDAGYFLFTQAIFDYINYGEDLLYEPFQRLIEENKLITYQHKGFWQPMDTLKDKMLLDELWMKGNPPWEVWNQNSNGIFRHHSIAI